jgi:hypothetical protein
MAAMLEAAGATRKSGYGCKWQAGDLPPIKFARLSRVGIHSCKTATLDNMSANNGDKSRYGRQRKDKINRRLKMRALRKELVEAKKAK